MRVSYEWFGNRLQVLGDNAIKALRVAAELIIYYKPAEAGIFFVRPPQAAQHVCGRDDMHLTRLQVMMRSHIHARCITCTYMHTKIQTFTSPFWSTCSPLIALLFGTRTLAPSGFAGRRERSMERWKGDSHMSHHKTSNLLLSFFA